MKKIISFLAALPLIGFVAGCSDDNGEGHIDLTRINLAYTQVEQTKFAQQSNQFANRLLTVLSAQPENSGQNICVAPMSIQYMMSMLANGADGETQKEMVKAMGFDNIEELNRENFSLLNKLSQDDEYVKVSFNNSVWLDKRYTYSGDYTAMAKRYYNATLSTVDFHGDTEGARRSINSWAKDCTKNLITSIPFDISAMTSFLIANANYFDGRWSVPFDPSSSHKRAFTNADGTETSVMTMGDFMTINCLENDTLKVAELPYGRGYYSMVLAMPKHSEDLDRIAANADWWGWHQHTQRQLAYISLPRYTISTSIRRMCNVLPNLGMPNVAGASFYNIDDKRTEMLLTDMAQDIVIQVAELGTKAASLSAVSGIASAPMYVEMEFDHPFIYAIRENTTGAILFMGKVVKL